MDFDKKLENAIERGQQRHTRLKDAEKQKALSVEDLRNRHNEFRLDLSEYIEVNLNKMAQHFPGFEYETLYGSKGWGGAIHRNDLDRGDDGKAGSFFSRIELTVKPQNEYNVVRPIVRNPLLSETDYAKQKFDFSCARSSFSIRL